MRIFLLVITLGLITSCGTKQVEETEENETGLEERVFDNADLLTIKDEDNLRKSIQKLEQGIGPQIAILTVDTLNGEDINTFSLKTFERLDLGRDKFKDGLLITVALKNREMRIEVGIGLENIIKDEIAARIIREDMTPKFREKDYTGGLKIAVDKISELIEDHKELVGSDPARANVPQQKI